MVDAHLTFVIIGGGLAGAKAAETLRTEGFAGRVILIGDERDHPYERPPLSKGFLSGKEERDSVFVHETAWYAQADIELHLGQTVVSIDRAVKVVRLGDDTAIHYDKLLLATGAEPRRLDIPGTGLAGVHHLRRLAHADRLRNVLASLGRDNGHLVIAGGAGSAWRSRLPRAATGPRSPSSNRTRPRCTRCWAPRSARSSPTCTPSTVSASTSARASPRSPARTAWSWPSRPTTARSTRPTTCSPRSARPPRLAGRAAGLELVDRADGGGIAVDSSLRTSDPDIYAAGDVAAAQHPVLGTRLRVEHWANALNGGPAAARAMLGQGVAYDRIPYFFSDQYDLGLEYSGWAPPGSYDQVLIRGDAGKRQFIAFWMKEGRLLAGMNVNVWDVTEQLQRLIRSGATLDPEALADPSVDLATLGT